MSHPGARGRYVGWMRFSWLVTAVALACTTGVADELLLHPSCAIISVEFAVPADWRCHGIDDCLLCARTGSGVRSN